MKRFIPVLALAVFSVGMLSLFAHGAVQAERLSPAQEKRITTNCVAIKTSLNQLHASDALLRVNRGQVYESLASRFMDTFNGRLAGNRLDNRGMTTITANYRTALQTFRTDYIQYEQKLADAIRTDCVSQPARFAEVTEQARVLRSRVHDDITKLHRLIDDYRSSVKGFLYNYERISQ